MFTDFMKKQMKESKKNINKIRDDIGHDYFDRYIDVKINIKTLDNGNVEITYTPIFNKYKNVRICDD